MTHASSRRAPTPWMAGFTLLELLVAVGIFGVLAGLAYGGLNQVLAQSAHLQTREARLAELQTARRFLGDDLEFAVYRPIGDGIGGQRPSWVTNDNRWQLEWTRAGRVDPIEPARAGLQRVAYGIDDESLVRHAWAVLDQAHPEALASGVLVEGVRGMQWRFHYPEGGWQPLPPGSGRDDAYPDAVAVELELAELGPVEWRFRLAPPYVEASAP